MKNIMLLAALVSIAMLGSSFSYSTSTSNSAVFKWIKLGTKKANYAIDRDVLHVGVRDGSFRKLKLKVSGANLNMHKMVVEYGDGSKERISVAHNFHKGSESRVIDLKGNRRKIKDITFLYDTRNHSRKKATIHVWGRR